MKLFRKSLPVAMIVAAIGLSGCSEDLSVEQQISQAQQLVEQNELGEALIALKNTIQANPENPEARLQLGLVYLKLGQYENAEKELERARTLNAQSEVLTPALARVHFKLDNVQTVKALIDNAGNLSDSLYQETLYYGVLSALDNNSKRQAEDYAKESKTIDTNNFYSLLSMAWIAYSDEEYGTALELISSAQELQPENLEGLRLKGLIYQRQKQHQLAVEQFKTLVDTNPYDNGNKLALVYSYIMNDQHEQAQQILTPLLTKFPKEPNANYYQSLYYFTQNNHEAAKEYAENTLNVSKNHNAARVIAGISAYYVKNLEQAYSHLTPIVDELSPDSPVLQLFTLIQVDLGYDEKLLSSVSDATRLNRNDSKLLLTNFKKMLDEGKYEESMKLLGKVDELALSDADSLANRGKMKLTLGLTSAIDDLEQANLIDVNNTDNQLVLVYALMQQGDAERALKNLKAWQEKNPESVSALNLEAIVLNDLGRKEEAEQVFKKVLEINGYNPASLVFFAEEAYLKNDFNTAERHLKHLLEDKPDHIIAINKLAKVYVAAGQEDKAKELMQSYNDKEPNNPIYNMMYARALFASKRYTQVIEVLEDPQRSSLLSLGQHYYLLLANSYRETEQPEKEINTFENWFKSEPDNELAALRLIYAYRENQQFQKAVDLIDLNASTFNNLSFKTLKTAIQTQMLDYQGAKETLDSLTAKEKATTLATFEKGRLLFAEQQYDKALPLLLTFYQQNPTSLGAGLISESYWMLDNKDKATTFIKQHRAKQPNDNRALLLLAQYTMDSSPKESIGYYETLVTLAPNNTLILNNLAYLYSTQSELDKAQKYIEQALKVAPNTGFIVHTAAEIAEKKGNIEKALELYQKAVSLAPDNAEFKDDANRVQKRVNG